MSDYKGQMLKKIALATTYISTEIVNNDLLKNNLEKVAFEILNSIFDTKKFSTNEALYKLLNLLDLAALSSSIPMSHARILEEAIQKFISQNSGILEGKDIPSVLNDLKSIQIQQPKPIEKNLEEFKAVSIENEKSFDSKFVTIIEKKVEEKYNPLSQENRKGKILQVLKLSAANLTDIKTHFEGITPKTIQRDLTELMREKKIIRMGEKRWAKYYLK